MVFFAAVGTAAAEDLDMAADSLTAAVRVDLAQIMVDEPIHFTFRIHNVGDVDLWRRVGGDYRNALGRSESFQCQAAAASGAVVPVPEVLIAMGGLMYWERIPAGGSVDHRLFLPNWAPFSAPGTYTLTCETVLKIASEGGDAPTVDVPVAAAGRVDVVATDDGHQRWPLVVAHPGGWP